MSDKVKGLVERSSRHLHCPPQSPAYRNIMTAYHPETPRLNYHARLQERSLMQTPLRSVTEVNQSLSKARLIETENIVRAREAGLGVQNDKRG